MPRGVYAGVSGVAKKAKKIYIGVERIAKPIKKGYIGINGVAKLFYTAELSLVSELLSPGLATARSSATGGYIPSGPYVLISGGSGITFLNSVETWDTTSMVRGTATTLASARYQMEAAYSLGDAVETSYIYFAGGRTTTGGTAVATVDGYVASSLVKSTPTAMSVGRAIHGSSTFAPDVGTPTHALFAGGHTTGSTYLSSVDAYVGSARTTPTALSQARGRLSGTYVGAYSLLCGGSDVNGAFATVDAYSVTLARTTPVVLSVARDTPGAAHINGYAIIAGGRAAAVSAVVDAISFNLVRTTIASLQAPIEGARGAATSKFVLFSGSVVAQNAEITNAYDENLVKIKTQSLLHARYSTVVVPIRDEGVMVAGGYNATSGDTAYVEVFKES